MMNKVYLEGQLAFSCCSGGTVAVPSALFRFISMTVGGGACLEVTAPAPVGLVSNQ